MKRTLQAKRLLVDETWMRVVIDEEALHNHARRITDEHRRFLGEHKEIDAAGLAEAQLRSLCDAHVHVEVSEHDGLGGRAWHWVGHAPKHVSEVSKGLAQKLTLRFHCPRSDHAQVLWSNLGWRIVGNPYWNTPRFVEILQRDALGGESWLAAPVAARPRYLNRIAFELLRIVDYQALVSMGGLSYDCATRAHLTCERQMAAAVSPDPREAPVLSSVKPSCDCPCHWALGFMDTRDPVHPLDDK